MITLCMHSQSWIAQKLWRLIFGEGARIVAGAVRTVSLLRTPTSAHLCQSPVPAVRASAGALRGAQCVAAESSQPP